MPKKAYTYSVYAPLGIIINKMQFIRQLFLHRVTCITTKQNTLFYGRQFKSVMPLPILYHDIYYLSIKVERFFVFCV